MLEAKTKKQQRQQQQRKGSSAQRVVALELTEADMGNQILAKRLRQLDGQNRRSENLVATPKAHQDITSKRPLVIELDAPAGPKRARVPAHGRVVFSVEDKDN